MYLDRRCALFPKSGSSSSIALIGFGLASLIQVFAREVVVWEFRGMAEDRERRAYG